MNSLIYICLNHDFAIFWEWQQHKQGFISLLLATYLNNKDKRMSVMALIPLP